MELPGESLVAGAGIPLNGVAPGVIETAMTSEALAGSRTRRSIEKDVPMPLGGAGTPEAVAALLVWLSGLENTMTTGRWSSSTVGATPSSAATRPGDTPR